MALRAADVVTRANHPAKDAADILGRLWADEAGRMPIPVDAVHIARKLGIGVFDVDLDADISGAIVKQPGADPTILLNREDSANRKRFTCAHEIGHYVRRSGEEKYEFVDRRGPLASKGVDPAEIYANQFAANLLMPEAELRRRFKKDTNVVTLAVEFFVSPEAMRFRLENLGLV